MHDQVSLKVCTTILSFLCVCVCVCVRNLPFLDDIIALNYALALEHLENAYYTKYVPQYSQDTFDQASINASYSYFQLIQQHETAHVNALSATITSMGGTPVRPWFFFSFFLSSIFLTHLTLLISLQCLYLSCYFCQFIYRYCQDIGKYWCFCL